MPGRFTRKIEDFKCSHCGKENKGNGYTDHCTECLWSKHVDIMPGDRAADCGGEMRPVNVEYKNSSFKINYKCTKCGKTHSVAAAEGDNPELLELLSSK